MNHNSPWPPANLQLHFSEIDTDFQVSFDVPDIPLLTEPTVISLISIFLLDHVSKYSKYRY